MNFKDVIFNLSALPGLRLLPSNSIDCVVTSPPYLWLRDYGIEGQIGLESTPAEFIAVLVEVFREVRRVLKPTGTLWINMGDSYVNSSDGRFSSQGKSNTRIGRRFVGAGIKENKAAKSGLKPKNMMGMPWRLAFALQDDGWYLRQDIIWDKRNPMPESVKDRCTKAHEYIFLLTKSPKYYFNQDAILEDCSPNTHARLAQNVADQIGSERAFGGKKHNGNMKAGARKVTPKAAQNDPGSKQNESFQSAVCLPVLKRNKRSVWTMTTKGFSEAHFATFTPELPRNCILAGCPPGGLVLDPFMGAGTTALVAKELGCHYTGMELNPKYVAIANKRLRSKLGLFTPQSLLV